MSFWAKLFGGAAPAPGVRMAPTATRAVPLPLEPETAAQGLPAAAVEDRFFRFVFSLPASADIAPSEREQQALQRLDDICGGDRYDVRSLPRMPTVLPQLLRALKNDDLNGAKLAELIGRDPVLVGEIMRVIGSVAYRVVQPITSLQHAIVLLGQVGLRQVVSMHVMKPILLANAGMFGQVAGQRLWDHAERCAHAAVYLSKGLCDPFEAHLAGLVSNTGIGAVARALDKELSGALAVYTPQFIASVARIAAELTLQAARYWELPPNVLEALAERGTATLPMSQVLHAANLAAMVELMSEHQTIERDAVIEGEGAGRFTPLQLARCRQDLRRQFASNEQTYGNIQ
ncbi:MAG TPA: HDOD domain-containing protein [Dyella sp.]|uniref:HDOD domain-containing protein n=1 Tax=Dyella sp. TaxID=1869338 RepID=UPI002F957EE5